MASLGSSDDRIPCSRCSRKESSVFVSIRACVTSSSLRLDAIPIGPSTSRRAAGTDSIASMARIRSSRVLNSLDGMIKSLVLRQVNWRRFGRLGRLHGHQRAHEIDAKSHSGTAMGALQNPAKAIRHRRLTRANSGPAFRMAWTRRRIPESSKAGRRCSETRCERSGY